MFQSDDLTATSFLTAKGFPPDRATRNGTIIVFDFDDLTEAEAFRLLTGPEYRLCRQYHNSLRSIRKLMDSAQGNGSGGGRR